MTKIKLRRVQVQALYGSIRRMDGQVKLVKDSDGRSSIVQEPYKFVNEKPVYAFSKTMDSIESEVKAAEKGARALRAAYPFKEEDWTQKDRDEHDERLSAFSDEEVEVEVHKIDVTLLKVHANDIPPTVLRGLFPMLDNLECFEDKKA